MAISVNARLAWLSLFTCITRLFCATCITWLTWHLNDKWLGVWVGRPPWLVRFSSMLALPLWYGQMCLDGAPRDNLLMSPRSAALAGGPALCYWGSVDMSSYSSLYGISGETGMVPLGQCRWDCRCTALGQAIQKTNGIFWKDLQSCRSSYGTRTMLSGLKRLFMIDV